MSEWNDMSELPRPEPLPPEPPPTNAVAQFFAAFEGRKTYIVVIVALIYLFGGDQGWRTVNESILAMLGFGGMAALRSSGPTKKPIVPILLALCLAASSAQSGTLYLTPNRPPAEIGLGWDASPTPEVTGYFIYVGTATRAYTNKVETGNVLTHSITNLTRGTQYFFTATAHDAEGLESEWCNEVTYTPKPFPLPPGGLLETNVVVKVSVQSARAPAGPWSQYAELTTAAQPGFFRSSVEIQRPIQKVRSPKHSAK